MKSIINYRKCHTVIQRKNVINPHVYVEIQLHVLLKSIPLGSSSLSDEDRRLLSIEEAKKSGEEKRRQRAEKKYQHQQQQQQQHDTNKRSPTELGADPGRAGGVGGGGT